MHSNRSSSLAFEVEKLHVVQEDDRMTRGLAFLGQSAYIPHLDVVLEVTSSLLVSSQGHCLTNVTCVFSSADHVL